MAGKRAPKAKASPKRKPQAGGKRAAHAKVEPEPAPPSPPFTLHERRPPSLKRSLPALANDQKRPDLRRRCSRRDLDEAADRAVQRRLGHMPSSTWEGLRNKDGHGIRDVVKHEISKHKDSKGRLSTKFWVQVFDEFSLAESLADRLAAPPEGEKVDENLLEALSVLHHENPACRRTTPLERFLDYCPELNRTSLFGLLKSVMESPTLPRGSAMKCQVAVLKYMVRTNAHAKHDDYFQVMRPLLDGSLQWSWEDLSARGVSQGAFLAGHSKLLAMFVDAADVDAIQKAGERVESVATAVKRVVESSSTGRSVFKSAWLAASRALFREEINERLTNLEHNDFLEAEVVSFKQLMVDGAAGLQQIGHKVYRRTEGTVQYLGQSVAVTFESANDEWEFRLAARAKTLAYNSNKLEPLPWESMLLPPGTLDGVPEFSKLPESLLCDAVAARGAALQFLDEKGATTLHQMIAVINSKAEALRALDRTFECEIGFLNFGAEPMLKTRVYELVLKCLPSEGKAMTIQQSMARINELKASAVVRAANPSLQGEVEGILSMLGDLAMGIAPNDKSIDSFSHFYKTVLKRAESFYTLTDGDMDESGPSSAELATLHGREALLAQFRRVGEKSRVGIRLNFEELQPLKTFGWVLGGDEKAQVHQWLAKAAAQHGVSESESSSSSSAGFAIVKASVSLFSDMDTRGGRQEGSPPADDKVATKRAEQRAAMMKFFVARTGV